MTKVTIAYALDQATRLIAAQQPDSPRLDAQLLLAACFGKPLSYLLTWPEKTLSDEANACFKQWVSRRVKGEPIAYILGHQAFWSLDLKVTPDTLIPRPDTEAMVNYILEQFGDSPMRVIDLGTGSGAIALALAHERPNWQVFANDLSYEAITVARFNAGQHSLPVNFFCGHWLEAVKVSSFDLIVSNPPYIAADDAHLASLNYEPRSALIAQNQGLACYQEIVVRLASVLKQNGWLFVEHGFQQGLAVREIFKTVNLRHISTERDLAHHERFTFGQYHHE